MDVDAFSGQHARIKLALLTAALTIAFFAGAIAFSREVVTPYATAAIVALWTVASSAWLKIYIDRESARAQSEHSVRFAALHTSQVRVVARIYSRLSRLEQAMEIAADPSITSAEGVKLVNEAMAQGNRFRSFCRRKRVWLKPATCDLLDELWRALKAHGWAIVDGHTEGLRQGRMPGITPGDVALHRSNATTIGRDQVAPLLVDLEREFRTMLGVAANGAQYATERYPGDGVDLAPKPRRNAAQS